MAEAGAPGRGATRGRCWFSGGEEILFFDLRKTAIRISMVCPVEFSPPPKARVSVFLTWTVVLYLLIEMKRTICRHSNCSYRFANRELIEKN